MTGAGLLHTLEAKVDPRHAAVLVIDVQNDFIADGGFADRAGWSTADHRTAVQRLGPLLQQARSVGVPVVFVQSLYDEQYLNGPIRERNERRGLTMPRCLSGTWGADFYGLRPEAPDLVTVKHRYSSFIGTDLDGTLRRLGVESVILTGVLTDVCVEATARDAYCLDYYTVMVSDCCATTDADAHVAALDRCSRDFGVVASSEEIAQAWERLDTTAPATAATV